jgi:hypothetical protein
MSIECGVCYGFFGPDSFIKLNCKCAAKTCRECISNHFKQECPFCRTPHNYPIKGTIPKSNIQPESTYDDSSSNSSDGDSSSNSSDGDSSDTSCCSGDDITSDSDYEIDYRTVRQRTMRNMTQLHPQNRSFFTSLLKCVGFRKNR